MGSTESSWRQLAGIPRWHSQRRAFSCGAPLPTRETAQTELAAAPTRPHPHGRARQVYRHAAGDTLGYVTICHSGRTCGANPAVSQACA